MSNIRPVSAKMQTAVLALFFGLPDPAPETQAGPSPANKKPKTPRVRIRDRFGLTPDEAREVRAICANGFKAREAAEIIVRSRREATQ